MSLEAGTSRARTSPAARRTTRGQVHLRIGVWIVYVMAAGAGEPHVPAGKSGELVEARWVSLAEAGELTGEVSEAVRQRL